MVSDIQSLLMKFNHRRESINNQNMLTQNYSRSSDTVDCLQDDTIDR